MLDCILFPSELNCFGTLMKLSNLDVIPLQHMRIYIKYSTILLALYIDPQIYYTASVATHGHIPSDTTSC